MTLAERLSEFVRAAFTGLWIQSFEHDDAVGEEYERFLQNVTVYVEGSTTYEWVLREANLLAEPEKRQRGFRDDDHAEHQRGQHDRGVYDIRQDVAPHDRQLRASGNDREADEFAFLQ